MTALSHLDSRYDAFRYAPVCEADEATLSVLSVLARHDDDPWQEAARLAQLSRDQAVNGLATKLSQSDSPRWSASEASILAAPLVELLPSFSRPGSNQLWADDGNGRLSVWIAACILFMSAAMSGNSMQKLPKDSASPISVSTMQNDSESRSSGGIGTD